MEIPSLYDRLFNSIDEAVIVTDASGRVSAWNARAEALYGWSAAEAVGRPIMELTVPGSSAEQAGEILAALAEGKAWSGEFRVARRDGSSFWARVQNIPLVDDDGAHVGVLGLSTDISEERTLRETLSGERRREEEMLNLAAHELRTPLTSVLGFAKRLLRTYRDDREPADSLREHLEIIVASAERMRRSMDFVLKLANLDRGQLLLESSRVDLDRVVDEEVGAVLAGSTELLVETERDEDDHYVQGDEDALRLILGNLLDNAIKYGAPRRIVSVSIARPQGWVVIEVADEGRGVEDADRDRLFERYFRGTAAALRAPGMGIGLHLSRRLATMMDGTLTLESKPGEGARFRLAVPAARTAA